jgi:hypothetical protein
MSEPIIMKAAEALQQYGFQALIGSHVVFVSEVEDNGFVTLKTGVIIDDSEYNLPFEPSAWEKSVLCVEVVEHGEEKLYPLAAHEQLVILPDSNAQQRIIERLKKELETANSMHLDNERYKYEKRGFGSVDCVLEQLDQLAAQVKVLSLLGAGVCLEYPAKITSFQRNFMMALSCYGTLGTANKCLALVEEQSGFNGFMAGVSWIYSTPIKSEPDFDAKLAAAENYAKKYNQKTDAGATTTVGSCKHGVWLYGNECLNCKRESEQGKGGAA